MRAEQDISLCGDSLTLLTVMPGARLSAESVALLPSSEVMASWPGQGQVTLGLHWLESLLEGAACGRLACLGLIIPGSLADQLVLQRGEDWWLELLAGLCQSL